MKMLLMNTGGGEGCVALADEAGVIAEEWLPARGTSEALMPAVKRVLAGVPVGELGVVGAVAGPGSFTGVRVGLSAAKGICEGVGCGMVAMSRLGLVAGAATGGVVALLDGGRGEFYAGVYGGSEDLGERLVGEAEARELMVGREAVTCEARVGERLGIRVVAEPGAETMRAEVLRRVAEGEWSDVATVDANYLRRTDAELLVDRR